MFEARLTNQNTDPATEILQGSGVSPEVASTLAFDPDIGALTQSADDGAVRMLVFRAHRSKVDLGDTVHLGKLSNGEGNPNYSLYGKGLYVGNSPASVGMFHTVLPDAEIGAYLTSSISKGEISDGRTNERPRTRLRKLIGKQALISSGRADSLLGNMDSTYAGSKVVILDKGINTVIVQNMWVKGNTYPTKPLWYLLRDPDMQLERVGTATGITPRQSIQKLRQMVEERDKRKYGPRG